MLRNRPGARAEDFAWTHGNHDVRTGTTIRLISNQSANNNTYHSATNNASGLAGSGAELYENIPGGLTSGESTQYTYAMSALLGLISNAAANYQRVRTLRAGFVEDPPQLRGGSGATSR